MDLFRENTLLLQALLALFCISVADRSVKYNMPGRRCGSSVREIDGALLVSSYENLYTNHGCVMKFITDDKILNNYKKFMVLFKVFEVTDCSVSLKLYYDRSSYGPADEVFDCYHPPPAVIHTPGRYLTVRLDKNTVTGYNFLIVITNYNENSLCTGFKCVNGSQCIDRDLHCDKVPNCIDGSDESGDLCSFHRSFIAPGIGSIMGFAVVTLVCCIMASILGLVCCRHKRRSQQEINMTTVHTNKPINVTSAPPPYQAYEPVPSYGPGYAGQTIPPQGYPMAPYYPPPQQGGGYPVVPGTGGIPQYV